MTTIIRVRFAGKVWASTPEGIRSVDAQLNADVERALDYYGIPLSAPRTESTEQLPSDLLGDVLIRNVRTVEVDAEPTRNTPPGWARPT